MAMFAGLVTKRSDQMELIDTLHTKITICWTFNNCGSVVCERAHGYPNGLSLPYIPMLGLADIGHVLKFNCLMRKLYHCCIKNYIVVSHFFCLETDNENEKTSIADNPLEVKNLALEKECSKYAFSTALIQKLIKNFQLFNLLQKNVKRKFCELVFSFYSGSYVYIWAKYYIRIL